MKESFKALIIIGLILILGCLNKGTQYGFNLNIVANVMGCSSTEESYTDHSIINNKLVLTTYAVTPDTCHKLDEIKTLRNENNLTLNLTIEEELTGLCGDCNGTISIVYEISEPLFNETNIIINIVIEKELSETHGFTIKKNTT